MAKRKSKEHAMAHVSARHNAASLGDAMAYRQACAIIERQFQKLTALCPGIETAQFMQAGETIFMWGVFSAMTGSDKRSRKLLANYLHKHAKMAYNLSEAHATRTAAASKWDPMVKEISDRGRQAYRDRDDEHLVRIAPYLLVWMGITPRKGGAPCASFDQAPLVRRIRSDFPVGQAKDFDFPTPGGQQRTVLL
jgi:hypothetical protein